MLTSPLFHPDKKKQCLRVHIHPQNEGTFGQVTASENSRVWQTPGILTSTVWHLHVLILKLPGQCPQRCSWFTCKRKSSLFPETSPFSLINLGQHFAFQWVVYTKKQCFLLFMHNYGKWGFPKERQSLEALLFNGEPSQQCDQIWILGRTKSIDTKSIVCLPY